MRVFVTGATGFLGKNLTRALLARGDEVVAWARRPPADAGGRSAGPGRLTWVAGDLADPKAVGLGEAMAGCEAVFHTAARVGIWGPEGDYRAVNVEGTRRLLAAAERAGIARFVHTSTPSVVYHGGDLAGADESLPLTTAARCPAAYAVTKAEAEALVLAADRPGRRTVALRPHLIWGPGDPHLIPRIVARARAGRLRIVGAGRNRVDLTWIDHAVEAHLLAEAALRRPDSAAGGRAYFISDGAPVELWAFINEVLALHRLPPLRRSVPLWAALAAGALAEGVWRLLRRPGEPPMTRFVAHELATDHWFSIEAARRDLGYNPTLTTAEGLRRLQAAIRQGPRADQAGDG